MTAGDRSPIELPKLFKPDPEHQKAVAQSWLGRVLGFGRSYGMAIAAFLAVAIILDQGITYILEPSWPARSWRLLLICGGLTVPAFWLYYAQRPRTRPPLFVQTELAKPGYFRIGPYEDIEKDRRAFHRADGSTSGCSVGCYGSQPRHFTSPGIRALASRPYCKHSSCRRCAKLAGRRRSSGHLTIQKPRYADP
jgi:hypothetical protein